MVRALRLDWMVDNKVRRVVDCDFWVERTLDILDSRLSQSLSLLSMAMVVMLLVVGACC